MTRDEINIKGKVFLVTGATGGIGEAIVGELAQKGAHLAISGTSDKKLKALVKKLESNSCDIATFQADLTEEHAAQKLVDKTLNKFGQLDAIISNAGGGPFSFFSRTRPDNFKKGIQLNLLSHIEMARAALESLSQSDRGHIVFIGSIIGRQSAPPRGTLYATAKAGLIHFAEALFAEIRDTGVSVTSILPDLTDTNMVPDEIGYDRSTLIKPYSVAKAVLFSISAPQDVCISEIHLRPQQSLRYKNDN